MTKPAAHRSSWTPEEVERLRSGLAEGEPPRDIARALGRTEEAVRRKARLLAAEPDGDDPLAYFRRRANEERERAGKADDKRIAAIHARFADMYEEIVSGHREPLSAALRGA